MANSTAETLIGAAVLAAAGGFLYYAAAVTDLRAGGDTYELVAKFMKADGVAAGGDVRISGVKVGTVRALELDAQTYEAAVRMAIRSGVAVPVDSSVKVASDGLLGGAYIAIEPGGSEYMLENGEVFEYAQGSVNILDLFSKAIYGGGS